MVLKKKERVGHLLEEQEQNLKAQEQEPQEQEQEPQEQPQEQPWRFYWCI